MLLDQRQHNGGIFTALTFMDRHSIGQDQFIQFVEIVAHKQRPSLLQKLDSERGVLLVNVTNKTDVAIEYALVVVISCLHDFVANPKNAASPLYFCKGMWIKMSLKPFIEQCDTDRSPVHRCKHLDITDRIEMIASWQTAL